MKVLLLVCFIFALGHSLYSHVSVIRRLKYDDLPSLTTGFWVVHFYNQKQADQQRQESFKKAAFSLEGVVKVGAIDTSLQKTDVDPSSCPLVRLYFNGKIINYNDAITAPKLVNFVKQQLSNVISQKLKTVTGYEQGKSQLKLGNKVSHTSKSKNKVTKKVRDDFETPQEIANGDTTQMSVLSDQVVSQKILSQTTP